MTTPEPRTGTVYALPPEPEVGRTVEVVDGDHAGVRFERRPHQVSCLSGRWHTPGCRPAGLSWTTVLDRAGPSGVRVVEGGEQHG